MANTGRILLVDDEEPQRRLLKQVLTEQGHMVIVAEDGYDGLRLSTYLHGQLDLLITDGTMPKLNGADMMHAMEVAGCLPPRVLVISGDQEEVFAKHLREIMPRDAKFDLVFLAKPVKISQILEAVDNALTGPVE